MHLKKLIPLILFSFSTVGLAGGTVNLTNKFGKPLEVFMKSSNIEKESGGGSPFIKDGEKHQIIGPKAASYTFSLRTFDFTSMGPTDQTQYILFMVNYIKKRGGYYELHPMTEGKGNGICYNITNIRNDNEGPHDFDVTLIPCY